MKSIAIVLFTGAVAAAFAREGFPITTDSPSFSDGTLIIPKGRWQIDFRTASGIKQTRDGSFFGFGIAYRF